MNIHEHDDYEKLAKLFYPSIEASGNVYYGQTRKLTMDEILGKNDMGFESHIESVKKGDDSGYDKFFQWKIGPLQGSIKVGDLYDFPIAYAKYRLEITKNTVQNVVHSASFPTYENDVKAIFDGIEYTENSPIDGSLWDGRHFYVGGFNNVEYLYIPIVNYYANEEHTDLLHTPLCLTNSDSSAADCLISLAGYKDDDSLDYPPDPNYSHYNFKYSYDNNTWSSYNLNTQLTLHPGDSVYFKGNFLLVDDGHINFTISSQDDRPGTKLYISGNINSLIDDNEFFSISDLTSDFTPSGYIFPQSYMFQRLFETDSYDYTVTFDASNLKLPATTLSDYCYYRMFYHSAIVKAPDLIAQSLAESCYESMFEGCRLLRCTPYIWSGNTASNCYKNMFYQSLGGSSIVYLNAYYDNNDASSINDNWLYGIDTPGVFIDGGSGFDNIPNDWSYIYENEDPLTICNVKTGGVVRIRLVKSPGYNLSVDNEYQYRYLGDDNWVNLTLSVYNTSSNQYSSGDAIILSSIPIQVRCIHHNSNQTGFTNNPENNKLLGSYVYFASQLPIEYDPSDDTVYDEPRICICGNVNSMISPDQYDITDISNYPYAFEYLFSGLQYVELVPNLYHTALSVGCYCGMFESTSVIIAPKLRCLSLSDACCYAMFKNCHSLEAAPDLRSLSLAKSCYRSAFEGCTSLITASELPATELAESCYESMFEGCINLTKAPELPATELADCCYNSMFKECTSLSEVFMHAEIILDNQISQFLYNAYSQYDEYLSHRLYCKWSNLLSINGSGTYIYSNVNMSYWKRVDLYYVVSSGATDTPNAIDNNNDYHQPYMITSGSDSDENGTGKLDGDGDYEQSFYVNGTHPMNSYNQDGSYNEEIWGYKSFNSPVQFRNGIYGDGFSLTTMSISDMPSGATSENYLGSILRCKKPFENDKYESALKIEYNDADAASTESLKANYKHNSSGKDIFSEITLSATNTESDISIKSDFKGSSEKIAGINLQSDSSGSSITLTADEVNISNIVVNNYDRVVTTHIAGSLTTGESQDVYGVKTFNDGIQGTTATFNTVYAGVGGVFADYIFPCTSNAPDSMIGNSGEYRFQNIYSNDINIDTISAKVNASVTLYANLLPADGLTVGVGTSEHPFNDVNALYLNGVIPTLAKGTTPGTDNPNIPVGAIVMLLIEKTGAYFAQTAAVYCGETIYSGGGALADGSTYNRLGVAMFRQADSPNRIEIIAETQNFLTSGMSFKVIIGGTNESQKDTLRCLAIRIE